MVDSTPPAGRSARDPEHGSPAGCTGDDEADEADENLIRELAALNARSDPVPKEVVEAARDALRKRKR